MEMKIRGKIIYDEKEYPATFFVTGDRNEEGGILVLVEETTAPDHLVPWSVYIYPDEVRYEALAGYMGTPLVDVLVEFQQEDIIKIFNAFKGEEKNEKEA